MVLGIAQLFNNFGGEVLTLESNGIMGMVVIAIFAGIWALLYNILSKNGEKRNAMTKWIPPLVSFLLTLSLVIDPSTMKLRTASAFLGIFRGFLGFVFSIVVFGYGILLANKIHKRNQTKWTKLFLFFMIFLGSTFVNLSIGLDISGTTPVLSDDSFLVKLGLKTAAAGGLLTVLGLIQTISLLGTFWFLITGIFGFGSSNNRARKYTNNVKTERQENLKVLDDSVRQINELMNKSSQIYKQIGDIVKNKSQITPQTAELLKTWNSVLVKLNSIFDNLKKVDVDKIKYRINPLDIGKTRYKDVEKIQLQVEDLKRLSTQMSQQISTTTTNIAQNKIQNIYNELYSIAMGWYNLATGYEKVSLNVRSQANLYKEDLELANNLDLKIKEFESLKLSIVKVKSEENKLFRRAIQSVLSDLDYESQKQDKFRLLNLYFKIFSSMSKYINSEERLNSLKNIKLISVKNKNYFEEIFNVIVNKDFDNRNPINMKSAEEVPEGEIFEILQTLEVGVQNDLKESEASNKAKKLEANFTALINQRNSIDELVRVLKNNKTFTSDFVVKIYNDSNLEVKNLSQIFENINNINFDKVDESRVKDINKFRDFVDSLQRFKSIFYTALKDLIDELNSMNKTTLDEVKRGKLARKLEIILRIINNGKLQNIDVTMIKDLIEG